MSVIGNKALRVAPPISGAGAGSKVPGTGTLHGVFRKAVSASNQRIVVPDNWKGREVTFQAVGLAVQVAFGGSAVSVTMDTASTVTSEAVSFAAASGYTIPAGQERRFFVPDNSAAAYFAFRSSDVTGFLEAYASDTILPDRV